MTSPVLTWSLNRFWRPCSWSCAVLPLSVSFWVRSSCVEPSVNEKYPDDVGEQVAGRILALVAVAVGGWNALGDDHPVGRDDGAPGAGEVTHDRTVVAGVGVVAVGPDDLDQVELDEEGAEQHHEADAERADLAVHVGAPTVTAPALSARRSARR